MNMHVIEINDIFDMGNYRLATEENFPDPIFNLAFQEKDIARTLKLIEQALTSNDVSGNWCVFTEIGGRKHRYMSSPPDSWLIASSYFLFRDKNTWVVGDVGDRGGFYPVAIFGLQDIHTAARYFVWIVSEGRAKLDWSLYLDMLD
jgi:hypothetical protein